MRLPKIPMDMLQQVIAFFRSYIRKGSVVEAMANLFWDRQEEKYAIHVPEQVVSKASVKAAPSELDDERYLHVADIHSHNTMSAKFSITDNEDEKATRLYIVIGKLDRFFPEINARISNGGKFHQIDPSDILEVMEMIYPSEWHSRVTIAKDISKEDADGFTECGAA
jgi:PRTRC genetic system protein A